MKNISLVILTLLFVQCHRNQTNKQDNAGNRDIFFVINYEEALQNKKTINLSEIVSEVNYIPLETDSNCLLCRKPEYHFTDQYIFIGNRDHVLVYDYNGKFIRSIGTPGRGPNEVDLIRMIFVNDRDKTIAIQTNWSRKMLYFTFEGTFIESITIPEVMSLYALEKDKFVAYDYCAGGFEDYILRLTNRNNDTIGTVKNHFKWENKTGVTYMIGYWGFYPCYTYNNLYYFKGMYNDTVYTVAGNEFKPAYYIDLGQYRLPDDSRFENPASQDKFRKVRDIYFFASAVEAANQIFITSINYADSIHKNIHYRRSISETSFLIKKYGEPSGFVNDYDGGPEFWPEGSINDNTLYMTVSPLTLKDMIEKDGFSENKALYPEKKNELIEMIERLKDEDNAVIMTAKL